MKKLTIEINIRNFIIGAAASAILICFGSIAAQAQGVCMSAQAIAPKLAKWGDPVTKAEILKERDCWVEKLKKGEKKMSGAFLQGADLSESPTNREPKFRNVDLTNANLNYANLSGVDLYGLNFTNAVMIETQLDGADLRTALFIGADLRLASLRSARVYGANFTNADLSGSDLEDCGFSTYEERYAEKRKGYSDEEWKRFPGAEMTNFKKGLMNYAEIGASVTLSGAKANFSAVPVDHLRWQMLRPIKGTSADYWRARGGVVLN